MLLPRCALPVFAAGLAVLNGIAFAQNYPHKPVRIVTSAIGGGNDIVARLIAQGISTGLGQQVIVDNRGNSVLAGEVAVKASPDGYTLILSGSSLWVGSLLREVTSFDPVRDFLPITMATNSPTILVVHPSMAAKSVKELIAVAKSRPGDVNYGSAGVGALSHLAGELLKSMAGVNIVHVAYKGSGASLNAVISNEVQMMFPTAPSVAPLATSGKIRALAVTSLRPSALAPGLPTVAAAGLPGFETGTSFGIFVPLKTPTAIINRLNNDMVRFINTADAREKFLKAGVEAVGSSPQQLALAIKSEMATLGKVIKDAGIKAD